MSQNHTRVPRVCEYCGVSFSVRPNVAARGGGRFCSWPCRAKGIHAGALERFWAKVDKNGPLHPNMLAGRCWVWLAGTRAGYGTITVNNRSIGTHVFAYHTYRGSVPKGMQVCHSCDNRLCVNP